MSNELAKSEPKHGMFLMTSTEVNDVNKAVLNTSVSMLQKNVEARKRLQNEINEKRQRYKYWTELFASEEQQKAILDNISFSGKSLVAQLGNLAPMPLELKDKEPKQVAKELAALLLWLDAQFNTYASLSKEQIICLSNIILTDYASFWLEDIAQCFRDRLKSTEKITNIDTSVILGWLTDYKEQRQKKGTLENINNHLATK